MSENLFPTLSEVAARTDALETVADDDARLNENAPALVEQEEGQEREMHEVESMCMRCHDNGTTRLLLTSIPYFKEIVVSSFRCDHCGHRDTEIQSAGEIQRESSRAIALTTAKGISFTVHLRTRADLDRQIVKSNFASVIIPSVELTIPPGRGQLTTVEGLIRDTVRDLNISQPVRRVMDPPTAAKIDEMLVTLRGYIDMEDEEDGGVGGDDEPRVVQESAERDNDKPFTPFSMKIEDPSGNSFFQFSGSTSDPQWIMRAFNRTLEQNVTLGLVAPAEGEVPAEGTSAVAPGHKLASKEEFEERRAAIVPREDGTIVPDEVFSFPSTCSSCGHELETLMQQVNIPYFQVSRALSGADNRISSSWRPTAMRAGTATTRSSPAAPSPTRASALRSRSRTRKTSRATCSNPTRPVSRSPRLIWCCSPARSAGDSRRSKGC
jgi:zinc finger protein